MIYDEAFKYFEVGYASALSWCLFVARRRVHALAFRSRSTGCSMRRSAETPQMSARHTAKVADDAALRVLIGVGFVMLYPLCG